MRIAISNSLINLKPNAKILSNTINNLLDAISSRIAFEFVIQFNSIDNSSLPFSFNDIVVPNIKIIAVIQNNNNNQVLHETKILSISKNPYSADNSKYKYVPTTNIMYIGGNIFKYDLDLLVPDSNFENFVINPNITNSNILQENIIMIVGTARVYTNSPTGKTIYNNVSIINT
jgi:hypothetical protein